MTRRRKRKTKHQSIGQDTEKKLWNALNQFTYRLAQCDCGCNGRPDRCRNERIVRDWKEVRTILFRNYITYASRLKTIMRRTVPDYAIVSDDDSLSDTYVGLLQAVDAFDASSGVKFSTFAYRRIRGEFFDGLRRMSDLPNAIAGMRREIIPQIQRLTHALGKFPTLEDLRDNLSDDDFDACMHPCMFVNVFNQPEGEPDKETDENVVMTVSEIRRMSDRAARRRVNRVNFDDIVKREKSREVLYYFYYMNMTLKEIKVVMECSISQASRLKQQGEEDIASHYGDCRKCFCEALYGTSRKEDVKFDLNQKEDLRKRRLQQTRNSFVSSVRFK